MSDVAGARKRRLFVGIDLDQPACARCAAVGQELQRTGLAAKYEPPEKLHVTLAFLGFVEPGRVDEIVGRLHAAAARTVPFEIGLDRLGAFPHERRPRVVYIGAREQGAPFRTLAHDVRQRYQAMGFTFDNDAVAHVTLARIKGPTRPLPLVEFSPIAVGIRSLALYESLPDPVRKTSRYEIIESAAF